MTLGPTRHRIAVLVAAATVLSMGGLTACSSAPDRSSTTSTTTAPTTTAADGMTPEQMAGMVPSGEGSTATIAPGPGKVTCAQHMPGDVLTAAEATVEFDRERVCLAYVTVLTGTEVSWHNTDTVDHTLTILDSSGAQVVSLPVAAGDSVRRPFPDVGIFQFKVSAITSFVGTVEVKASP